MLADRETSVSRAAAVLKLNSRHPHRALAVDRDMAA